jgi:hypothetical protein
MSTQERDVENIEGDNSNSIIANELSQENDASFSKTESNSENNKIVEVAESVDTEEKPRKNRRKIEREVYALVSENEALKQKNASMEELLHKSLEAGNYHYGTVAMGLLDKAKANLAKALGEGDVEAVATATAEIAQATSAVNDAKRVSIPPTSNNSEQMSTNSYGKANGDILYDWLDDNPDLDKGSPEYNESLTNQVLPFINKLENRLKRNNQMHLISSPEYFNIIDEYVDKIKDTKGIKDTRGKHFGSVRSRHQATNVSEKPMVLTLQQKKAAASFNMTEEKYINYLQKYAKEAKG